MNEEAYKKRIELAESNLAARDSVAGINSTYHPVLVIARVLRSRMETAMRKATFNERDIVVDDLIRDFGRMLEASGFLKLRSEREAWYHACGVEVP